MGLRTPDHDIAPGHLVAVGCESDAVRTVELLAAQSCRRRIDLRFGRRNRFGADLGANGGVDQRPHRLSERLVDAARPGDVVGAEVLQGPIQHTCTRTRSISARVVESPRSWAHEQLTDHRTGPGDELLVAEVGDAGVG